MYWGDSIWAKVSAANVIGSSGESPEGNGAVITTNPNAPTSLANDLTTTSATTIKMDW